MSGLNGIGAVCFSFMFFLFDKKGHVEWVDKRCEVIHTSDIERLRVVGTATSLCGGRVEHCFHH